VRRRARDFSRAAGGTSARDRLDAFALASVVLLAMLAPFLVSTADAEGSPADHAALVDLSLAALGSAQRVLQGDGLVRVELAAPVEHEAGAPPASHDRLARADRLRGRAGVPARGALARPTLLTRAAGRGTSPSDGRRCARWPSPRAGVGSRASGGVSWRKRVRSVWRVGGC
jgi:hypothetical protein